MTTNRRYLDRFFESKISSRYFLPVVEQDQGKPSNQEKAGSYTATLRFFTAYLLLFPSSTRRRPGRVVRVPQSFLRRLALKATVGSDGLSGQGLLQNEEHLVFRVEALDSAS